MPFVEVKTNVQVKSHKEFLTSLTSFAAKALSKPVTYICVSLQDNISMFFNNSDDPAYVVNISSLGNLNPTINKAISKELSEFLEKELGVDIFSLTTLIELIVDGEGILLLSLYK